MRHFTSFLPLLFLILSNLTWVSLAKEPVMHQQPSLATAPGAQKEDVMTEQDFNQLMDELGKMSNEELKALEEQLLASMTPEEREEVKVLQNQMLRDMGIDPKMLEAETAAASAKTEVTPTPSASTEVAPGKDVSARETVSKSCTIGSVQILLDEMTQAVHMLRQKAAIGDPDLKRLLNWTDALNDIAFFLAVIHKPVHHDRLATEEFHHLMCTLKQLNHIFKIYEPRLNVLEEFDADIDNPYEILGLSPFASAEEIEHAYTELEEEKSPEKLKARLKEEGLSLEEIKQQTKAARLNFSIISDAYEQLSDPKNKEYIDKELMSRHTVSQQESQEREHALSAILSALSKAIYDENLLKEFETFLKKYEPTELAHKKELDEAEKKQRQVQEKARSLRPIKTPGTFEPYYAPGYTGPRSHMQRYAQAPGGPREWGSERTGGTAGQEKKSDAGKAKKADAKKKEGGASTKEPSAGAPLPPSAEAMQTYQEQSEITRQLEDILKLTEEINEIFEDPQTRELFTKLNNLEETEEAVTDNISERLSTLVQKAEHFDKLTHDFLGTYKKRPLEKRAEALKAWEARANKTQKYIDDLANKLNNITPEKYPLPAKSAGMYKMLEKAPEIKAALQEMSPQINAINKYLAPQLEKPKMPEAKKTKVAEKKINVHKSAPKAEAGADSGEEQE